MAPNEKERAQRLRTFERAHGEGMLKHPQRLDETMLEASPIMLNLIEDTKIANIRARAFAALCLEFDARPAACASLPAFVADVLGAREGDVVLNFGTSLRVFRPIAAHLAAQLDAGTYCAFALDFGTHHFEFYFGPMPTPAQIGAVGLPDGAQFFPIAVLVGLAEKT